jgi:hypothetical protein
MVLLALLAVGIVWAVRPLAIHDGPENWFPQADKLHHLWFFALLWWLALRAGFAPSWTLVLGLMAYGLGMELAQAPTWRPTAWAWPRVGAVRGCAACKPQAPSQRKTAGRCLSAKAGGAERHCCTVCMRHQPEARVSPQAIARRVSGRRVSINAAARAALR